MKVAIVAIAKLENLYLKEWVDYHLNLGFDRIIICDNNDEDGERVFDVIKNRNVTIRGYIGKTITQSEVYKEIYKEFRGFYDWILFIDIDEFLVLNGFSNVKDYLSLGIFKDFDVIRICWDMYTDSNMLDVVDGDYSVMSRFKERVNTKEHKGIYNQPYTKCFVKTSLYSDTMKIINHNVLNIKHKECDCNGDVSCGYQSLKDYVYGMARINHYMTKTIGEFLRQKFFRGGINHNPHRYQNMDYFFFINEYTDEKMDYALKVIKKLLSERGEEDIYNKIEVAFNKRRDRYKRISST